MSVVDVSASGVPQLMALDNSAYDVQKINRKNQRWMPQNRSGDAALIDNFWLMLARLRDLGRNDVWSRAARRKIVRRAIGKGVTTKADVKNNPEFNAEADELFSYWGKYEADAAGRLSWSQMQRQMVSELIEAGEVLLIECSRGGRNRVGEPRNVPLCYQVLEAEQIDDSQHQPYPDERGNRTIRGIELDQYNSPVAYWIFQIHPDGLEAGGTGRFSQRVPANRVTHLFDAERPSQTRGASNLATSSSELNDLRWLRSNELMKSYIQSIFTVGIHREFNQGGGLGITGSDDSDDGSDSLGNPLEKLGPGLLSDLGPNDKVDIIESKGGGGANFDAFVKHILMGAAAGCDMSYIGLTGDYASANFSAARAAGNDDYDFIEILQDDFSLCPVIKVRRAWTRVSAAMGRFSKLPAATFNKKPEMWLRANALCPGRKQVDVEKESMAAIKRIASGLSTWQIECARLNLDWREVFAQLKLEWSELEANGMMFDPNKLAIGLGSTIVTQATQNVGGAADNSAESNDGQG